MRGAVVIAIAGIVLPCAAAWMACKPDERLPFGYDDAGPPPAEGSPPLDLQGECLEETKQIFVLTTGREIHRFDPMTERFVRVGPISCATDAKPFSMAIDRRATAWVLFDDGSLFAVDTTTGNCRATEHRNDHSGFFVFGMGFARDDTSSDRERLYLADRGGLATLDTSTFELTRIADHDFERTELTAADTRLYGFSVDTGKVHALDKETGAITAVVAEVPADRNVSFAFAQWGGDFWLFTGEYFTRVARVRPDAGAPVTIVENAGFLVIGAGASTCAPIALR